MTNDNLLPDVMVAVTREATARTYEDLFGPAFKDFGQAGKAIAYHLTKPFQGMIWEMRKQQAYNTRRLEALRERLADIPPDKLLDAPPLIAGPVLEGGRWVEDEPDLMSMFDDLLASAMDPATAAIVHPAFARIIKELTPDEAKIIRLFRDQVLFASIKVVVRPGDAHLSRTLVEHVSRMVFLADCERPGNMPTYANNLERLGLIKSLPEPITVAGYERYDRLINMPFAKDLITLMREENPGVETTHQEGAIRVTTMGQEFAKVCVRKPPLPLEETENTANESGSE